MGRDKLHKYNSLLPSIELLLRTRREISGIKKFCYKRAFNHVVFDVKEGVINATNGGAYSDPEDNSKMIVELGIIDRFEIKKM